MASRQERPLRFNTGCTYMYTLPLAAWLLEVESPLVASTCMRLTYFQFSSYNHITTLIRKQQRDVLSHVGSLHVAIMRSRREANDVCLRLRSVPIVALDVVKSTQTLVRGDRQLLGSSHVG